MGSEQHMPKLSSERDGAQDSTSGVRKEVRVLLASSNALKVAAVQRSFTSVLGSHVSVQSGTSESGIPHGQPWGMQMTMEGALTRVHHLQDSAAGFDFLVAAENGVVVLPQHQETFAFDIACVVVEDVMTKAQGINFSQSRHYPLSETQALARSSTTRGSIGTFCANWYAEQEKNAEESSLCSVTRDHQIESATRVALSDVLLTLRAQKLAA
mmetsp:Transcript_56230/g.131709  ORF Transcript_56230/g.131709 Transcript_56230/m.131709 type:complete len:212 (-) Transcript_56230:32-667(-)